MVRPVPYARETATTTALTQNTSAGQEKKRLPSAVHHGPCNRPTALSAALSTSTLTAEAILLASAPIPFVYFKKWAEENPAPFWCRVLFTLDLLTKLFYNFPNKTSLLGASAD